MAGLDVGVVGSDGEGSPFKQAHVLAHEGDCGLKVFTKPLVAERNNGKFYANPSYGIDMNVNGLADGGVENIHNGLDHVYWTATANSGSWTFDSSTQAFSGTQSIDGTSANNGANFTIARGSTIETTAYVELDLWIYITGWDTRGTKNITIEWANGGTSASGTVNVSDYVDTGILNVWQKVAIPITSMNVTNTTVDELVFTNIDIGAGPAPNFYIDNIQLVEAGTTEPIIFTIQPNRNEVWDINNMVFIMVDEYDATLANATMSNLSPYGFLGVPSLSGGTGIQIRRYQNRVVNFNAFLKDFMDLIGVPGQVRCESGSDGTHTWVRVTSEFPGTFTLDGSRDDRIEMVINDDLTGFSRFRVLSNIQELTTRT